MTNDILLSEGFVYFGTDTKFPRARTPMTIQGVPVFEAQNYYVVMGEEKSGKSHFLSLLLSAFMYGGVSSFGIKSLLGDEEKILYLDTEQSPTDAQAICHTANLIVGKSYDAPCHRLFIASSDSMTAEETMVNLEKSIQELRPAVVFIDGYAGLLDDNYQNKGAESVMKRVRYLAREYNTSIIGIWHTIENAITGKKSAFGAAGKLSQKFGGGTMLVNHDHDIITVTHLQSRKSRVSDLSMKLCQKIVEDRPGGDPQVIDCDLLPIEELLSSMGKSINDEDVHTFAVPVQVDKNEAKAQIALDMKSETLRRRDMKERTREPQYREKLIALFGQKKNEFLSKKDLLETYKQLSWHEDHKVSLSEPTGTIDKREKDKYRKAFSRMLEACIRLGIVKESVDTPDYYCYLPRAY